MLVQVEIEKLINGLTQFLAEKASNTPVSAFERLSIFLSAARPLLKLAENVRPPAFIADPDRLIATLAALTPALEDARRLGLLINPWKLAGLKRNEVRNSAALAGLWSMPNGGKTAVKFLASFLGRLKLDDGRSLLSAVQLGSDYSIRVEDCPLGDATERVDLVIESQKFIIGIEVKIDAPEGDRQLERYKSSLEQRGKNSGREVFLVYLAPPNRKTKINVIRAHWSDVARSALDTINKRSGYRSFNEQLIANFAAHIADF